MWNFFKQVLKRMLEDRAFKVSIITATDYFYSDILAEKILALLSSEDFVSKCLKKDVNIKIEICETVEELDLGVLKEGVRELLGKENLTRDQKIILLKIKLDAVFNGDYPNKKVALLAVLTAIMDSIILVGPYGVMIFLAAINQLWKEGKI